MNREKVHIAVEESAQGIARVATGTTELLSVSDKLI